MCRGVALLFSLTQALDVVGGQRHTPAAFFSSRGSVPIIQETGWAPGPVWTGAGNLATSPGFDRRTVQPVASRCTDYAIPTHIYTLWGIYNVYYTHYLDTTFYHTLIQQLRCGNFEVAYVQAASFNTGSNLYLFILLASYSKSVWITATVRRRIMGLLLIFEWIWREVVVAQFDVISQYFLGGTWKTEKPLDIPCSGQDSKRASPEYKSDILLLRVNMFVAC